MGLPYLRFTDEPQTVATAAEMAAAWDPNPRFFAYGSLMIQLDALVDRAWMSLAGIQASEVITLYDVPDRFFVSHPELVWANRCLTVVVAAAGLVGAAAAGRALVRRTTPAWADTGGVLSALAVAGLPRFATHSAMATQDAPLTAFVLLAVAAALHGQVALAGLFAGFAASCKVSAALAVLPALVAAALGANRARAAAKALVAALGGFVVGTPFAVLDAPTFLADVRLEAWHYGAARPEVSRGLPHLVRGLGSVALDELAGVGAILAAVGAVALARRGGREALVVGVFPLAFALQMSLTTLDAQRNWLPIAAFGAVAAVVGAGVVREALPARIAGPLAVLFAVALGARALARVAGAAGEPRDTRTRFAEEVGALAAAKGWTAVGVSTDVRMHPRDLARLPGAFEVPADALDCRAANAYIVAGDGVPGAIAAIRGRPSQRGEGVRFDPSLVLLPGGPATRACPTRAPEKRPPGLWERRKGR